MGAGLIALKRPYSLAILLLLLIPAQALSALAAGGGEEVKGQMPVRVIAVNCEPLKNETLINVLVRLPNPGYNLERRNVTLENGTAVVELWFSAPQGPVIQLIKDMGVVVRVNGTVERIKVLVNGTIAYQGPCGQGQSNGSSGPGVTSEYGHSPQSVTGDAQESSTTRIQGGPGPRLGVIGAGLIGAVVALLLLGLRRH